jgi:hypothetical protein
MGFPGPLGLQGLPGLVGMPVSKTALIFNSKYSNKTRDLYVYVYIRGNIIYYNISLLP